MGGGGGGAKRGSKANERGRAWEGVSCNAKQCHFDTRFFFFSDQNAFFFHINIRGTLCVVAYTNPLLPLLILNSPINCGEGTWPLFCAPSGTPVTVV